MAQNVEARNSCQRGTTYLWLGRPSFRFSRFHFLSYNSPISRFRPSGDASYGEWTLSEICNFFPIILEMKQNGNHHVSSISYEFKQGNLHQRKGNCESFPTPCGMLRYIVTSCRVGLFPSSCYREVVFRLRILHLRSPQNVRNLAPTPYNLPVYSYGPL